MGGIAHRCALPPRRLLLTRTVAVAYLNKVMLAEVTTTVRGIPQEVPLGRSEGVARGCVANFDNVHVMPIAALEAWAGVPPKGRERKVKRSQGEAGVRLRARLAGAGCSGARARRPDSP